MNAPAGFPLRVVVTGAESTGKTTLAMRLGQHFGCPVVPEQLRLFVERSGRLPEESDIPSIVDTFIYASMEACESADRLVIYDTDLLSTLIYHEHYFGKRPESLDVIASTELGHFYVLAQDDIPWIADSMQRDGEAVRRLLQDRFHSELVSRQLPFLIVSGGVDDRFDAASDWISNHLFTLD